MLAELTSKLFVALEGGVGRTVVALLDPNCPVASSNPLHISNLAARDPKPRLHFIERRDRLTDPEAHPFFVVLRSAEDRGYPDPALLQLSLECALQRCSSVNGAYISGWLVVSRPPSEVVRNISKKIISVDLISSKRRVNPFFEPHRLMIAAHYGGSGWLHWWLEDIVSWIFLSAAGRLIELNGMKQVFTRDANQSIQFWEAQSRIWQSRSVLVSLHKAGLKIPEGAELSIDQAIIDAHALGLSAFEDIVLFALNQLTLVKGWAEHPLVQVCLSNAASGDVTLADGLIALPDSVLGALSAGAVPLHQGVDSIGGH